MQAKILISLYMVNQNKFLDEKNVKIMTRSYAYKGYTSTYLVFWIILILNYSLKILTMHHCVKSVQMRSFVWSAFSFIWTEWRDLLRKSLYSVRIQENTDQKKTPYLDTFHTAIINNLIDLLDELERFEYGSTLVLEFKK